MACSHPAPRKAAAHPTRVWLGAVVAAGALAALGCAEDGVVVCAPSERRSVVVTVTDSVTGQPAAAGARGSAESGGVVDSLEVADALILQTPGYRAGVYTVRVQKAGYATWQVAGVAVRTDGCFSGPARLAARLQAGTR